jgi:ABC-type transport system substrate-binding protein
MLKFRVVTFFILFLLVLGAYQIFVPAWMISNVHAQGAAKKEQKITATIALPGVQVETLHPYGHSTTQVYPTWKHVIEPLFEWSWSKKQLVPILAESWTNPDHTTWVFKLKKGIKFHDGSDFTSADVVHSYTRIQKDPDSKHRGGGSTYCPLAHEESGRRAAVPPGAALHH